MSVRAAAYPFLVVVFALSIPAVSVARESVEELAHRTARARGLTAGSYSFFLVLPDGSMFGHRELAAVKPASCFKLLTAALALDALGPEATFDTDLRRSGPVESGTLAGDLVVVGRGDPNRPNSSSNPIATLERWADTLEQMGIVRIRGDLVGDDTFFAGPVRLDDWPRNQWHKWYSAPCGALNLNDNCIDIRIAPIEGRPQATLFPPNRLFKLRNELKPVESAKQHRFSIDRRPGRWEISLKGKFLSTRKPLVEWVTVEHPTLAYLGAFAGVLESRGITIEGGLRRQEIAESSVLIDRVGHSVAGSIPRLIKKSMNLHGDCLIRYLDRSLGGDGSYASAAVTAETRARERFGWKGPLVVRDGSGLSHQDRMNTRALVGLLLQIRRAPWGPIIRDALPVAGRDGTLKRRFAKSGGLDRLRAKTGHLSGVSSLAGYLDAPGGEAVFALIFNGPGSGTSSADRWQEDFLRALDARLRPDRSPGSSRSVR